MEKPVNGAVAIEWSPAGGVIAVNTEDGLLLLAAADLEVRRTIAVERGQPELLAVDAGGERVAAVDGTEIKIWDIESGEVLASRGPYLVGHFYLKFVDDGRLYLGTVYGGGDTAIGALTQELEAAPGPSTSFSDLEFDFEQPVAVSPDGDRLAIHRDGIELYGPSQEEPLSTIDIHALEMRFAHDGNSFVVLGSNCRATVFGVGEGQELRSFEWCSESPAGSGLRFGLQISRDGRYAAAADAQGTLRMWELGSGGELRNFSIPARNSNSLSFNPEGSRVAWLGEDGLLQIWEIDG